MNDITITCSKCGAEVPLSEAVSHRIREQLAGEFQQKLKERESGLSERERQLREAQQTLEQRQKSVQAEVARQLSAQKEQLLAQATREAQEKLGLEMNDLQARLEEQKCQLKQAQDAELDLRKKQRELEEQKRSLELEVARTLEEERSPASHRR